MHSAPQYHYWPSGDLWDAWSVETLIRHAEGRPTEQVCLDEIPELDTNYWFHGGREPTVRNVASHVIHAVRDVDPAYPVILGPGNRVMDGMHRIVRALVAGDTAITAVRLDPVPPPDLRGCQLGDTLERRPRGDDTTAPGRLD